MPAKSSTTPVSFKADILKIYQEAVKAFKKPDPVNFDRILQLLKTSAASSLRFLATYERRILSPPLDGRTYEAFGKCGKKKVSRPYRPDLFLSTPEDFESAFDLFLGTAVPKDRRYAATSTAANAAVYTAVMAFACASDLGHSGGRNGALKMAGTFFEVLVGCLIGKVLPEFSKQASVEVVGVSVKTDIVFTENGRSAALAISTKTTSRERIAQVFINHLLLKSLGGKIKYETIHIGISEVQRDKENGVKATCIPDRIAIYWQKVTKLTAMIYLDPPQKYLDLRKDKIEVTSLGDFLSDGLNKLDSVAPPSVTKKARSAKKR